MKQVFFITSLLFLSYNSLSQVDYGTPPNDEVPEKLSELRRAILVQHFPKTNNPIKIDDTYYWKHSTGIFCEESKITITEFGAYIYYNDQWNLRESYPLKKLDVYFGTKKHKLNKAEPYTWAKNYRTGKDLFGGWALWYFIGTMENGETVCGFETINTTANLIN